MKSKTIETTDTIIIDKIKTYKTSIFLLGSIIATSYFPVEILAIITAIEIKNEKIPNSSGL